MGRKRRARIEVTKDKAAGGRRPGRGRKLALLLALAGAAATWLVRRNQRKAEIDEGIWHEAPAPSPTPPSAVPTS